MMVGTGNTASQVLRDFPRGLTVKVIVDEIERRGLRSFEGKANPTGQVREVYGSRLRSPS